MTTPMNDHTLRLDRPGGRVAYDLVGSGPLVVLVPGMGDLRRTYRHLVPVLADAGYRVASTDLRGHGDSDTTFSEYGDEQTASDIVALVEHLGGPAVVVGNSMGAGAAVIAAADRPDLVAGLALLGPFVRDAHLHPVKRALMRVALSTPVIKMTWGAYLPKLYAGRRPDDLDEHLAAVRASLSRPGHAAAFAATTRLSHASAERRLADVNVPSLVLMGELDPDFPDPAAEAAWIGERLHAPVVMVPEAGHYPQSQRPDAVAPAVLDLLASAHPRA
jgi:pimeloyl-ACP methyl ester carboxylesterase